jgi:hypothetical protein
MVNAWGTQRPIFVDLGLLEADARMASGAHPVLAFLGDCVQLGLRPIPVTGPDRDIAYQQAVRAAMEQYNIEPCIRVEREDFLSPNRATLIGNVLTTLGTTAGRAHIVLDVFAVDQAQMPLLMAILPAIIASLPNLNEWSSFTLLGGAFPVNLSDVSPGIGTFQRNDWALWHGLSATPPARVPAFGDYGISHPAPQEEIDPRVMHISASIRYTAEDTWLIFRGRDVRHPAFGGFTQFRQLSAAVVAHPSFSGAPFSWGDGYINSCAAGTATTGNHTTWRRVGTNHHLTYVVNQLSNHFST